MNFSRPFRPSKLIALALAVGIAGLPGMSVCPKATAQVAQSEQLLGAPLTGAWLTTYAVAGFTTTVPVLLTFHDDRTVLETDSSVANPLFNPPAVLSDGHGAWTQKFPGRNYTFYYRKLIFAQADSTPDGSTSTLANLTLSPDSKSFQATIQITFYDKNNKVTNQTSGTVTGTRIEVPGTETAGW